METRVQVATHFTIDPARQTLGAIQYPEKATVTLVVGDQIDAKKVDFAVAFTPEQMAQIEEKLNCAILEAGRTAKPIAAAPSVPIAAGPATAAEEESGLSLF